MGRVPSAAPADAGAATQAMRTCRGAATPQMPARRRNPKGAGGSGESSCSSSPMCRIASPRASRLAALRRPCYDSAGSCPTLIPVITRSSVWSRGSAVHPHGLQGLRRTEANAARSLSGPQRRRAQNQQRSVPHARRIAPARSAHPGDLAISTSARRRSKICWRRWPGRSSRWIARSRTPSAGASNRAPSCSSASCRSIPPGRASATKRGA